MRRKAKKPRALDPVAAHSDDGAGQSAARPPGAIEAIAAAMASNAVLWIFREVGLQKGTVPPPGWTPPDPVGKNLQDLLAVEFRPEAKRLAHGAPDPLYQTVDEACLSLAKRKYGDTA